MTVRPRFSLIVSKPMGSDTKSLKANNRRFLTILILVDLAIYWGMLGYGHHVFDNGMGSLGEALRGLLSPVSGLLVTLPVVSVVLLGLVPSSVRAKIAFWKIRNELPASRAFSRIGPQDVRVDMTVLAARYGPLPAEASAQNKLWYRIYTKHEARPAVRDVHGDFLLTRDIAAVSVFFLFTLGPAIGFGIGWVRPQTLTLWGLLVLQHVVAALAAQNYGERFVATVLAWESAS